MEHGVTYAIEIVDRWSKPLNTFEKQVKTIGNKKVTDPFRDLPKSLGQLKANIDRYKKSSDAAFRTDHVRKYNILISETEKRIKSLEKATETCAQKTDKWGSVLNKIGAAAVVYKAVSFAKEGVLESLKASAQVEKYQTTLKVMLGSRGAARQRMQEYADIAMKTPFELSQVVEGGNQLTAIGRYSRSNLTMLGDLASASGRSMDEVMAAFAKIATGQKGRGIEEFRNLLISTDDWVKATGKGLSGSGELMASTEEMIAALPKIMKTKGFFGMMDEQSRTTEGRISNLKDAMFGLKVAIGDRMKPTFDGFLSSTQSIIGSLTKWTEIPLAEKIIKEKTELNNLVGIATQINISTNDRFAVLNKIQQQYPEFLGNIDKENVKNDELLKKLNEVNTAYERKIALAQGKSILDKTKEKSNDTKNEIDRINNLILYFNKFKEVDNWFSSKYKLNNKYNSTEIDDLNNYYEDKLSKNPNDKTALEFTRKYAESKTYSDLIADNQKWFKWYGDDVSELIKLKTRLFSLTSIQKEQEKNVNKLSNEDILKDARSLNIEDYTTFEKMFGKYDSKDALKNKILFNIIRRKNSSDISQDDYDKLSQFMSGGLKIFGNNPEGGSGTGSVEHAGDTISGGGKNIKQLIINLGSLINTNNNNFTPGQGPKEANQFLQQLEEALLGIVNDVNYVR